MLWLCSFVFLWESWQWGCGISVLGTTFLLLVWYGFFCAWSYFIFLCLVWFLSLGGLLFSGERQVCACVCMSASGRGGGTREEWSKEKMWLGYIVWEEYKYILKIWNLFWWWTVDAVKSVHQSVLGSAHHPHHAPRDLKPLALLVACTYPQTNTQVHT